MASRDKPDFPSFKHRSWCLVAMLLASAQPVFAVQNPHPERTHASLSRDGFQAIERYRPDLAIKAFVPVYISLAKRPLNNETNRKLTAQYMALLGRAFNFDESETAAYKLYAMALRLDPDNPSIKAFLLDAANQTGKWDVSARLEKEIQPFAGKNQTVAKSLAANRMRIYDFDGARKILDGARKAGLKLDHYAERLYLQSLLRQGFAKGAAAHYKKAIVATDNPYVKKLYEGSASLLLQKREKALLSFREAGKILPDDPSWHSSVGTVTGLESHSGEDALAELEKAVELLRFNSRSMSQLHTALVARGMKKEAERCVEHFNKVKPWAWDDHFMRARAYKQEGDFQKARDEWQKVLAVNPESGAAYMEICKSYKAEKNLEKALSAARKGSSVLPLHVQLVVKRAKLAEQLGLWDEAIIAAKEILRLVPKPMDELNVIAKVDVSQAHETLGVYAFRRNERAEAVRQAISYNKFKFVPDLPAHLSMIKIRPGHLDFDNVSDQERRLLEHVALADMLLEARMLKESIAEYKKAIEINADNVDLHSYLLNVLVEHGDWLGAAREDLELSNRIIGRAAKDAGKLTAPKKKEEKPAQSRMETTPLPPVPPQPAGE